MKPFVLNQMITSLTYKGMINGEPTCPAGRPHLLPLKNKIKTDETN